MKDTDHSLTLPALGTISLDAGFHRLERCSDGIFVAGEDGVAAIVATGDRRVEFIAFADRTIAYVRSALGYPAYYPVHPVALKRPVRGVLMDLDGTSVRSEDFWIWIIQQATASLLGNPSFELSQRDLPFVSGHSVSEHLQYCIDTYCPDRTVEAAREHYFRHTRRELAEITAGRGRTDAFQPAPGLKDLLLTLKRRGIKIGLVTSGLHEKAYPAILSVFRTLGLGDPEDFYDAIITAGFPLQPGRVGTLGELSPKPHPWLYAEAFRVGLGMPFEARNSVLGIEDSGAGVCSLRLAGLPTAGVEGGNIVSSGTQGLCQYFCRTLQEILEIVGSPAG